jgi:hypothetical protein
MGGLLLRWPRKRPCLSLVLLDFLDREPDKILSVFFDGSDLDLTSLFLKPGMVPCCRRASRRGFVASLSWIENSGGRLVLAVWLISGLWATSGSGRCVGY